MNDAQRLDELRTKLRRICGHKELSAKQEQAALDLVREIVAIEGVDGKGGRGVAAPAFRELFPH
jgi:hypothetical protein